MHRRTLDTLIERIRRLRAELGLTQEGFAEKAHISYKYYQAIEAGRKPDLRLSTLERLARAHGLEVWELLLPSANVAAAAESASNYGRKPKSRSVRRK
jgi:transcriptional regulator with XRE-family HTH domain